MKNILKSLIGSSFAALMTVGCTGNFEEYNTNPYDAQELDVTQLFSAPIKTLCSVQQNDSQMIDQMVAGTFGGYFTMSNSWGGSNFNTYNATDGWNSIPFDTPFQKLYGNYFIIQKETAGKGRLFALAQIIRVGAMLRVTDCYGPIPYSQLEKGKYAVAYDSQEVVYTQMFKDLDFAIKTLNEYLAITSLNDLQSADPLYGGDYALWLRFANSLKLRMAIRISNVKPELAKKMAEEAVTDAGGVIDENSQNAKMSVGLEPNPYNLAASSWNDLRVNASIVCYMNGYDDPRRTAFFTSSTVDASGFMGMRSGTDKIAKGEYTAYSQPKFGTKESIPVFVAAEVSFLRAEGALKGWNMGGKSAQEYYEDGIRKSFAQYGASGVDTYISNTTAAPAAFVDAAHTRFNYTPKATTKIAWTAAENDEAHLEQIITQKWIANWTIGFEAWADYRRTGYPEFFPVVDNLSNGVISTARQQRRLPFPFSEKQTNKENVTAAAAFLGGPDTGATDLWWAKKTN